MTSHPAQAGCAVAPGTWRARWSAVAGLLSFFLVASPAMGQAAAGYSEYYIPGNENNMGLVLCSLGATACPAGYHMHTVISVTAYSTNYKSAMNTGVRCRPG